MKLSRLLPIDALRGLIMVVMALDHANLFIARAHSPGEFWNRPLPLYPDTLAFMTRLVTHLAAPGFFFLMGVGITLYTAARRQAGWSGEAIAGWLVVRGLLLIALQFLVENPAWRLANTPGGGGPIYIGVLYALGGALILGALFEWLGTMALLAASAAAILFTQDFVDMTRLVETIPLWQQLLLVPGFYERFLVYYPLIPWLGLTGLGMLFGRWLRWDERGAYRDALLLGLASVAGFLAVRWAGSFGNIRPAEGEGWIAFLNVVKYPPSLAFILLTLGVNLILLSFFAVWLRGTHEGEGEPGLLGRLAHPLIVFGQSPLFFYLVHLYLYAWLGRLVAPRGIDILRMYPWWLAGLAILYPLCWLFGRFKHRQPPDSPWRLF